jgi:small-conductance mechanosensitive channel
MDSEQPCPVCRAGSLGATMMRDCHLGRKTTFQVAAELDTTNELVMKHINESHELTFDEDGALRSQDRLMDDLLKTLKTLKTWTDYVVNTVKDPNQIDRAKVDMLVRLSQEARKTIESVATLQGRKGPGDTHIQMQILNGKVVLLTNTIIDVACPDCKMKILDAIEGQPLLMEAPK